MHLGGAFVQLLAMASVSSPQIAKLDPEKS